MTVSSIQSDVYSAYSYLWSNQQLQEAIQNTSSTSSTSSVMSTFSSYEGSSTISSMVELAQYAMDAMGISANEKVTFAQIVDYQSSLESAFSESLSASIQASGVADDATFSIALDADGNILVSSTHDDSSKIQQYFDDNPDIGTQLREALTMNNVDTESTVYFSVDATGTTSVISSAQQALQSYFDTNTDISSQLLQGLEEVGTELSASLSLSLDEDGVLSFDPEHPEAEAIQSYLDSNPDMATELQTILAEQGFTAGTPCTLTIDTEGAITASVDALSEQDILVEDYLTSNAVGLSLKSGLESVQIDENIEFSLSLDSLGNIVVNSSNADASKVQALIDADTDLTLTYLKIDALSGLDAARESLQIDLSAMRSRIVMENILSSWETSDDSSSSIGVFSSGSLSTFYGLNSFV